MSRGLGRGERGPGRALPAQRAAAGWHRACVDGWIVAEDVAAARRDRAGDHRAAMAGCCPSTPSRCRAGTASPTWPPRSRSGHSSGLPAAAIRARRRRVRRRGASPGAGRGARTVCASSTTPRAPSRTRSSPRCAASRSRWCSSAAAGPRACAMDDAGGGRRGTRDGRGAHRRERTGAGRRVPGGRPGAHRACGDAGGGGRASPMRIARAAATARRAGVRARRPCCSARPRRASTCSRTTRPAAAPSRPPWRPWSPRVARGTAMTVNARPAVRGAAAHLDGTGLGAPAERRRPVEPWRSPGRGAGTRPRPRRPVTGDGRRHLVPRWSSPGPSTRSAIAAADRA